MSSIIGIDLGTSNYCVAVIQDGKPVVIKNSEGALITPSVISFDNEGGYKVGAPAKRQAITNPQNTIYSIKRIIGKTYSRLKEDDKTKPYKVVKDNNDNPCVEVNGRLYTPQEICAILLTKAKKDAEDYLGEEVKEAVVAVPVHFNYLQRKAIKEAGELAGLRIRRLISEPAAAALNYGLKQKNKKITVKPLRGGGSFEISELELHNDDAIAILHMGGGSFDFSIFDFTKEVVFVRCATGNTQIGGDDFDYAIINWLAEGFIKDHGIDLRQDPTTLQRLKEAAEKAKIELSSASETEINLPYITQINGVPQHLIRTLARDEFEQMIETILYEVIEAIANLKKEEEFNNIHDVILVGGATRVPSVQKKIEEFFQKKPVFCINPDEAVAIGAATEGAIFTSEPHLFLLDATPLSLGIETKGGAMNKIVDANSSIPLRRTGLLSTEIDNQTSVEIRVFQGEYKVASQNTFLGKFTLDGIPPMARGVPQIEVCFDVNSDGKLTVTAKEKVSGKQNSCFFCL